MTVRKNARSSRESGFGRLMYHPVAEKIAATRSELLMISPYFVPMPGEVELLAQETRKR